MFAYDLLIDWFQILFLWFYGGNMLLPINDAYV